MKIATQTFGTVTAVWVNGSYSGTRSLRVSAAGQRETTATTRPAKTGGEYIVELAGKWTRADGTQSPGFKISSEQFEQLQAERAATETDGPLPLGKAQLWEE